MSNLQNKAAIIQGEGGSTDEELKSRLLGMPDLLRDFTWAEIDGVRRVTTIVFTSAILDAELGQIVSLVRVFTYLGVDPFDLDTIQDTLVVV